MILPVSSGNQPHGVLENPRTEWRFLIGKIIHKWWIFQHAMFDYTEVRTIPIGSMVLVYLPIHLGDFVRANVGKDQRNLSGW